MAHRGIDLRGLDDAHTAFVRSIRAKAYLVFSGFSGRILDSLLTEKLWFALSSPRRRRFLFSCEMFGYTVSGALALAAIDKFRAGGHAYACTLLTLAAIAILWCGCAPLGRFLAIERRRDAACAQYLASASNTTSVSAVWPKIAVRNALQMSDRATAIILYARECGVSLEAARAVVDRLSLEVEELSGERILAEQTEPDNVPQA